MKDKKIVILLVSGIFLMACNLSALGVPTVTPTPITPTGVPTTIIPAATPMETQPPAIQVPLLSEDLLKNAEYTTPQYNKTVTLTNGKYEAGSGADYFMAVLLPQIAYGDLNGDGLEDAAILLGENGGGSGVFVSVVAMINQNGKPIQSGAAMIDDRPKINSLTIKDGKIVVEALIHGPNDAMVNPTFPVTQTYQLTESRLALTRFTSRTPSGEERAIQIEGPLPGALVSGPLQVKGSMTIGPFENNLIYRIYDEKGNKLAEGPFPVNSNGTGGPAMFDHAIDLPLLPTGAVIRLELVDANAVDGSTLAMDSVRLITK